MFWSSNEVSIYYYVKHVFFCEFVYLLVSISGPHGRREADSESYVLSSDEEEDTNGGLSADLLSSLQASSRARY